MCHQMTNVLNNLTNIGKLKEKRKKRQLENISEQTDIMEQELEAAALI